MRRRAHVLATLGLTAALGVAGVAAAAPASAALPTKFCIPIILPCDKPTPEPTPIPSPSPSSSSGSEEKSPAPTESPAPEEPAPEETPAPEPAPEAVPDDGAPLFTLPPAQMGSDALSFTGLKGIQIVTVPLADGTRTPALKISAESITVDGFGLTVRREVGPVLATTADRMTLSGDVSVYLSSLTATTADGTSLTLGTDTPPPADGITPRLLRVTFGLVGATADSITYSNTNQHLSE